MSYDKCCWCKQSNESVRFPNCECPCHKEEKVSELDLRRCQIIAEELHEFNQYTAEECIESLIKEVKRLRHPSRQLSASNYVPCYEAGSGVEDCDGIHIAKSENASLKERIKELENHECHKNLSGKFRWVCKQILLSGNKHYKGENG